ncbi:DUF2254 domain-containing protein [Rhizobiales bacterium]|uniref:DUF2254 domain-containing protein n=1 Tax=Hongsoonwoonella zoysiae TaxID=2821844 RepID=UPI00155FE43F|nr:DUF2254 domain-containing protein [Hongsoonwoonella zoysiae]NRG17075.1 DUF2254 domain-containing protein [Hongsoonwoonella zoysiae]
MTENWLESLLTETWFYVTRLKERLWVRPLAYCLSAVACVLLARFADLKGAEWPTPYVEPEMVEKLLTILSTSMLAVATFAVSSMVAAYASASTSATPRAFSVVVADDVSKTALSSFIGAFIFSVVGVIAVKTGFYERSGLFVLFLMTLGLFAWVVLTFIRWVDRIARLGRMGHTIQKVEAATRAALDFWGGNPNLGGVPPDERAYPGEPVTIERIGFVQMIDMPALQEFAEKHDATVTVASLPGTFMTRERPAAFVRFNKEMENTPGTDAVGEAFITGNERTFAADPRFGFIVLSEISSRALSPSVNDPGTAIAVIGSITRLLSDWARRRNGERPKPKFDRVFAPNVSVSALFDDAFMAISRDGAAFIEVGLKLQRTFAALDATGDQDVCREVRLHAWEAAKRAQEMLVHESDRQRLKAATPAELESAQ